MKAIAVTDRNLAIGRENGLLFKLPGDLKRFKERTLGGVVIMGRKTLESLPGGKPLPGRHTLVLSKTMESGMQFRGEGEGKQIFGVFADLNSLLDFLDGSEGGFPSDKVFVCGGEAIYSAMLPYCDEIILTEVDAEAEGPDTYFPAFKDCGEWELRSCEGPYRDGDLNFEINRYTRKDAFSAPERGRR